MSICRSSTGTCYECGAEGVPLAALVDNQEFLGAVLLCGECLAEALQVATGLKFQAIYRYNMGVSLAAAANRAALLASGKPLTRTMRQNIAKKSV